MASTITLTAKNNNFDNPRKPYVAMLHGLTHGAETFDRDFLGKSAIITRPGMYEVQDIPRKGKADQSYYLVIETADGLKISHPTDKERAVAVFAAVEKTRRKLSEIATLVADDDGDLVVMILESPVDPIDSILAQVSKLSPADRQRLIDRLVAA